MRQRHLLLAACLLAFAASVRAAELDATEIVRRSDDRLRRSESYARMTMEIVRPEWTRTLVMDAWTQGASNSFIRVLSPKKERGVTFLKRGREAWQYVPAVDRVIKIPPSMMLQSWLGSDFTNDDVVRADSLVEDYTHSITDEVEEDGKAWWIIEGIPKPDAPVVWGRVVFKVDRSNYVADRVDYFDEDGELVKYYRTDDVREVEGQEIPLRLTMFDETEPGHRTTISYEDITFSPELEPDLFTPRNLRR